jgi:predicted flap endonuclease-1-like 5' DNA nuclease
MIFSQVIYKLYPQVVRTIGETAYDADGNEVAYDKAAVEAKVIEMQAEEAAKNTAALEKLAALGLTPEDLQRILGVK